MQTVYGYGRVSHRDKNEVRQVITLEEAGIPAKRRYIDKKSGKDFERPKYQRLLKKLKPGDAVFVPSIDRLGRNYTEILEQWRVITKEKQADIVILDMPLLDTRKRGRDLTGTFVADLVLSILSYCAENERENIRKRQAEGIAAAKAQGVMFGRKPNPVPEGFDEAVLRCKAGEYSEREAARRLGVSANWFYRHIREMEQND